MKKSILLSILLIVSLTSGCVTTTPKVKRIPFPEDEYKALPKTGSASVKGQAFLKTLGGDVKYAAGCEVILNPVTSYSSQWYHEAYLVNKVMEECDPRLYEYSKLKVADGEGRFVFNDVPVGEYYLTTVILWYAPTGYQGSLQRQGGAVSKIISVKEGDNLDFILTK